MKIVCVDNFDRETISDVLICENIAFGYGEDIVKFLNDRYSGNSSSDFYKLVSDDYKLFKFEP